MADKKVRVNGLYYFNPVLFDQTTGDSTKLFHRGQHVRVINKPGCPKANTMGMCYIVDAEAVKDDRGQYRCDFAMVMTNSLDDGPILEDQVQVADLSTPNPTF